MLCLTILVQCCSVKSYSNQLVINPPTLQQCNSHMLQLTGSEVCRQTTVMGRNHLGDNKGTLNRGRPDQYLEMVLVLVSALLMTRDGADCRRCVRLFIF